MLCSFWSVPAPVTSAERALRWTVGCWLAPRSAGLFRGPAFLLHRKQEDPGDNDKGSGEGRYSDRCRGYLKSRVSNHGKNGCQECQKLASQRGESVAAQKVEIDKLKSELSGKEADMAALMRPAEGQGMLSAESARLAAQAPAGGGATYGGFSRQPGDTAPVDEERLDVAIRMFTANEADIAAAGSGVDADGAADATLQCQ